MVRFPISGSVSKLTVMPFSRDAMGQSQHVNSVPKPRKPSCVSTTMAGERQGRSCFVKTSLAWSRGFSNLKTPPIFPPESSFLTLMHTLVLLRHRHRHSVRLETVASPPPIPLFLQVGTHFNMNPSSDPPIESTPTSPNASWSSSQSISSPSPPFVPDLFYGEHQPCLQPPLELSRIL